MSKTIGTEAGAVTIEATPAGVIVSGRRLPVHEALSLAAALVLSAQESREKSKALCSEIMRTTAQG